MTSNELKELVKNHFSLTEVVAQTFGELKDINGAFTLLFEGDVLEVGKDVKVRTTEGQELTAPDGTHELENGEKIVVEGGKVVSIEAPSSTEEMVDEIPPSEQEQVVEEKMEEVEVSVDTEKEVAPIVEEVAKAVIEAVKDEIEAMKKDVESMKAKLAEMEDAPATEKASPESMSKETKTADVFNKQRFDAVMARAKKQK